MLVGSFVLILLYAMLTRIRVFYNGDPKEFSSRKRLSLSIITTFVVSMYFAYISISSGMYITSVLVFLLAIPASVLAFPLSPLLIVIPIALIMIIVSLIDLITLRNWDLIEKVKKKFNNYFERVGEYRKNDPAHPYSGE